jgi:methionyl-tRNA formyltransferase
MKVLGIGYRDWAISIYKNLSKNKIKIKILKKKNISLKEINKYNPDIILFYGWSKKVSNRIVEKYKCVMLHPSKLPDFAGGSPLQNQIIRNIKKSAITLFVMNKKIDQGNIIAQKMIMLTGELRDIFNRIVKTGTLLSLNIIKKNYIEKKIRVNKIYKRRSPSQSEITHEEIKTKTAIYLYNKIRMLQDPYPNAYIKTFDGKKLYIQKASIKNPNYKK